MTIVMRIEIRNPDCKVIIKIVRGCFIKYKCRIAWIFLLKLKAKTLILKVCLQNAKFV